MEKRILQSESQSERVAQLKNSADKVQLFSYPRELAMAEIQEMQSQLSQDMIQVDREEQVLKVAKEIYKAATKPVKQTIAKTLGMIRSQIEEVNEEVYLMKDREEGKMGYYSKEGILVFERHLLADEMQYSITELLKKTN
jgi:E3 ubiquitin-protein ligase DOA10